MNYYDKIKNELIDVEVYTRVKDYSKNKYQLEKYYNVGRMLIEAQGEERAKYGDSLIKEYSKRLTNELGKGYTATRLRYYRRFFEVFSKRPTLSDKLSYSHYCEIMWLENKQIDYYIQISVNQNLSVRELRNRIKSNEYERLPDKTKLKLTTKEDITLIDSIKNPIIIKNKYNTNSISEKILKQLILEDISSFMKELGEGFCFIDSEYKIKIGDNYNYIDILLYNLKYRCYVVLELKVTELKSEYTGQIGKYMNFIDKNIKTIYDDKTVGIIICRKDNKYIIEYCSDPRIISCTYELV